MTAILVWGVGILLSSFIVFGWSTDRAEQDKDSNAQNGENEQESSGDSVIDSHPTRDFNQFVKFCLVLSMYAISMQIIMGIVKIAIGFPISIINGTSILGMVFNAAILIAEILTFKKNRIGLIALIVLFIARFFLLVPMGTGSYSYFLGGNLVLLFRDFGLFAIAMCFKKNGVSGWRSMLASSKQNIASAVDILVKKSVVKQINTKKGYTYENKYESLESIEKQAPPLKNVPDCQEIEELNEISQTIAPTINTPRDVFSTKNNSKELKKLITYVVVLILIAFGQAIVKALVEENHNHKNDSSMYEQFDELMYDQAKKLNNRLPLRIDEYTTCISVSYSTKNGRILLTKYRVSNDVIDEIRKGSVMQEIKKEMMKSMKVQYVNTKDAIKLMKDCKMMYKYEYYDRYGNLLNSYILFPNEVIGSY